jgi:hypothetical protein
LPRNKILCSWYVLQLKSIPLNYLAQPLPDAERTQRHLGNCQELAELGMQLARKATALALAEPPPPKSAPGEPPAPRATGPNQTSLFLRLSSSVRQAMAMEARIAAGHPPPAPRLATPKPAANPQPTAQATQPPKPALQAEELPVDAGLFTRICHELGQTQLQSKSAKTHPHTPFNHRHPTGPPRRP